MSIILPACTGKVREFHVVWRVATLLITCFVTRLYCRTGSRQDAADSVADGLHETLSSHSRTSPRDCSQVDAGELDGRDQTLGAVHAVGLSYRRPSPAGESVYHRYSSVVMMSVFGRPTCTDLRLSRG